MGQGARLTFVVLCALMVWGVVTFQPPLWLYPTAFVIVFLFYTNTLIERVPLYLSNATTWAAVGELLDSEPGRTSGPPAFVDLGCGLGGLVAHVARTHPAWRVVGVETAPGPYLIAKARTAFLSNAQVRFQSLWNLDLANFDVAYAFLSPVPMKRLTDKAKAEMPKGGLLVSNSFWADDVAFDGEVLVNDARETRLIFRRK